MAIATFGWPALNHAIRAPSLAAGSQVGDLGPGQLQNDQGSPATAWQTAAGVLTPEAGAWVQVLEDWPRDWRAFVVARTNLTANARLRWRVGGPNCLDPRTALVTDPEGGAGSGPQTAAIRRLLAAGQLGGLTVARASAGATYSPAGVLSQADANTPRWSAAERLFVEGPRTNFIRNPRAEGAVVGDIAGAGSLPTTWATAHTATPIITEVVGTGVEGGIPYVDVRLSGTPTSGGQCTILTSLITSIPAAQNDVWAASAYVTLRSGVINQNQVRAVVAERSSTGTPLVEDGTWYSMPPVGTPLRQTRCTHTRTITGATAAYVTFGLRIATTLNQPLDCIIRIGAPQVERGYYASSVIFPPVGDRVPSTRAADMPTWTPAGGFGSEGAVLVKAVQAQAAPAGAAQGLLQIDDGTDANRIVVECAAGSSALQARIVSGGAALGTVPLGSVTLGGLFSVELSWAPGAVRAALNAGTQQSLAVTAPGGLTTLRVGHAAVDGSRAWFGGIAEASHATRAVSLAGLQPWSTDGAAYVNLAGSAYVRPQQVPVTAGYAHEVAVAIRRVSGSTTAGSAIIAEYLDEGGAVVRSSLPLAAVAQDSNWHVYIHRWVPGRDGGTTIYLVADTGPLQYEIGAATFGQVPEYDSGLIAAGVAPGYGQSVLVLPEPVQGQLCRLDISDPSNPDGFINVPLLYAGDAWTPDRNIGWESAPGSDAQRDEVVTRGGQEFPSLQYARRRWDIDHKALGRNEVWPQLAEMIRSAQAGGNCLFVPDPDSVEVNREAVYGRLTATNNSITYPYQTLERRAWRGQITERL
jgi:hypothetical protein